MKANYNNVRCRAGGHMWEDDTAGWKRKPYFGFRISWRCLRCGSWRHVIIDSRGEVAARSYDYAPGYSYAKDDLKPSKADYRIMLLKTQRKERVKAREEKKAGNVTPIRKRA